MTPKLKLPLIAISSLGNKLSFRSKEQNTPERAFDAFGVRAYDDKMGLIVGGSVGLLCWGTDADSEIMFRAWGSRPEIRRPEL
ncbi:hypothetical protein HRR86_008186 [Exophiala dermatitidis]|nr:hypothetical protein HRR77_007886 [Exophiala dermatitidis]KAJ4541260.1 hypothetical protein HRR78_007607 [Exophiala dermatitidis]KAJ4561445.1 hypothetical protein HRR79_007275 [Exophiala dermatitidis]KAJ4563565.1 hypothetical protein HRR82_009409 [Exophiala dermatitidis]KAJ4606488.1 hypothetical protein HRR85_007563 [Exophiala dermatitidis]